MACIFNVKHTPLRVVVVGLLIVLGATLFATTIPITYRVSDTSNGSETTVSLPKMNVILMIGDGLGVNATRVSGIVLNNNETAMPFVSAPHLFLTTTENIMGGTTDSAAAATAIATGQKTSNGRVSMDAYGRIAFTTIIEHARSIGYLTGIITTTSVTHATPASFTAHNAHRWKYFDIALDQISLKPDILFGGGLRYYRDEANVGERTDQDLVDILVGQGYTFVNDYEVFSELTELPIIGLFGFDAVPRETMRPPSIPSLRAMTEKSISLLSADERPFFMMIEGGQIDWGGHANDIVYLTSEAIAFSQAFEAALAFVDKRNDTLPIVTADHETGGLGILGQSSFSTSPPKSGDPLLSIGTKLLHVHLS
ncbi:MAG: alkaline phosphatase [Candidatus Ranarchaeia archaeon]